MRITRATMTVAQLTALAQGASLGGFTYHLTRMKVYDASSISMDVSRIDMTRWWHYPVYTPGRG